MSAVFTALATSVDGYITRAQRDPPALRRPEVTEPAKYDI
jgi:hypothetical protein